MFFPDRIKNIGENDKVLEIGPGATPHPRANVFLEKRYQSEAELILQSGNVGILSTQKPVFLYNGGCFPFADKEFDYIICSHVLEHVDDVPFFLSEIFRVASRGYLEFPSIYYDYYNDIPTHLNMLRYKNGEILWCKKINTPIPELKPFTLFFNTLQESGYRMQNEINQAWHFGFEFSNGVKFREVQWQELCFNKEELATVIPQPTSRRINNVVGVKESLRLFLTAIGRKFRIIT